MESVVQVRRALSGKSIRIHPPHIGIAGSRGERQLHATSMRLLFGLFGGCDHPKNFSREHFPNQVSRNPNRIEGGLFLSLSLSLSLSLQVWSQCKQPRKTAGNQTWRAEKSCNKIGSTREHMKQNVEFPTKFERKLLIELLYQVISQTVAVA